MWASFGLSKWQELLGSISKVLLPEQASGLLVTYDDASLLSQLLISMTECPHLIPRHFPLPLPSYLPNVKKPSFFHLPIKVGKSFRPIVSNGNKNVLHLKKGRIGIRQ